MFAESFHFEQPRRRQRPRGGLLQQVLGVAAMLGVSSVGLRAQSAGDSAGQIASMNEDVQMLSRQVSQLQVEVETLNQSNAELQKAMVSERDVQAMVQNALSANRGDSTEADAALRKEILDEVSRQIAALAEQTNVQLEKLAKAIQTTPPTVSAPTAANGAPLASVKFPDTGVTYVVQQGDTISLLARKYNSSIVDIEAANHITDPARGLRVGRTIFIPQKNPAPAPAAPASASPTPAP